MIHSLAVAEPDIGSKTSFPSISPLYIACPCPIVADVAENNDWGFTEACPTDYLQPGDMISSPGGHFRYEIVSYPFSRLYLDFRGLIAGVRGTEAIDTPQRQFYKFLFLLLTKAMASNQIHLPVWLLLSLTGRLMPHLDNSAWTGYPRRPIRSRRGNYLSYQRRLVAGQMVETFTWRWSDCKKRSSRSADGALGSDFT